MSRSPGAWSVPDYGEVLARERIRALVTRSGLRPCVLFGASGCGKSIAVADYCLSRNARTLWIHADGRSVSPRQLASTILLALGEPPVDHSEFLSDGAKLVDLLESITEVLAADSSGGPHVVLDDVGEPTSADSDGILQIGRALWEADARLLVTTRSVNRWSAKALCGFAAIGPEELALDDDEARDMLGALDLPQLSTDSVALREACGGHVAFFTLLATQAKAHGLAATVERTASLDAWLERIVQGQVSNQDRNVLFAATVLGSGDTAGLENLGVHGSDQALRRIAASLPLVTTVRHSSGKRSFRVHDLVLGYFRDRFAADSGPTQDAFLLAAVGLLTDRHDFARAAEALARLSDPVASCDWLERNGDAMLAEGHFGALERTLGTVTTTAVLGRPKLLLLWAELCAEFGQFEDALAKARAARSLAEHAQDKATSGRATARCLRYTSRAGGIEAAAALAQQILGDHRELDATLRAEALICVGHACLCRGDWDGAVGPFQTASELAASEPEGSAIRGLAEQGLAILPGVTHGDFMRTSRLLRQLLDRSGQRLSFRVVVRGNLSWALIETGRLDSGRSLLKGVVRDAERHGLTTYLGAYLPAVGCVDVASGEDERGIRYLRAGIEKSLDGGDESEADQTRVHLAVALRSVGEHEQALVEAERAFDRLSGSDLMDFRRLAALEVAASLLALGDSAAARSWTETVVEEGFKGNLYHSLRADMILAEIERREGRLTQAVARLAADREYILSENPNWQVAMYCRAFPELLGLFALAVGADRLPSHMLRMILPEQSERCLIATRSFLDEETWSVLGERLIGAEETLKLVARDGLPMCHVRLFGGLEVSVGGRTVRERDWKKRKARLLFAMLVSRRGRDVPRDQVFEYLWPDLDEERARNNLYVAWSTMKSVLLGPGTKGASFPYVESVGGVCRTVRDTVRSDVDEFEEAIVRARDADAAGDARQALAAYEAIGDLYRGDLLPGDCYDDWFAGLRDHYRIEFVDAMLRATQLLMDADDPGNALIFARRAIQSDPCREDLYQCALRCQIAAGQRSSAIDTYFQCRDKLADELGLDPSVETRALYDKILAMEDCPRETPLDPMAG